MKTPNESTRKVRHVDDETHARNWAKTKGYWANSENAWAGRGAKMYVKETCGEGGMRETNTNSTTRQNYKKGQEENKERAREMKRKQNRGELSEENKEQKRGKGGRNERQSDTKDGQSGHERKVSKDRSESTWGRCEAMGTKVRERKGGEERWKTRPEMWGTITKNHIYLQRSCGDSGNGRGWTSGRGASRTFSRWLWIVRQRSCCRNTGLPWSLNVGRSDIGFRRTGRGTFRWHHSKGTVKLHGHEEGLNMQRRTLAWNDDVAWLLSPIILAGRPLRICGLLPLNEMNIKLLETY